MSVLEAFIDMSNRVASGRNFRKKKSEIVFLGDCLRPDAAGQFGGVNLQTRWLFDLLREPVSIASGVHPSCLLQHPVTGVDVAAVYRKLPGNTWLEKWANVSTQKELLPLVIDAYRPHLSDDCFCIGFELSANLRQALLALGVPYIDLWVHPIRFMDDLLLAATSNSKEIRSQLSRYCVPEQEVRITAGLRNATLSRWPRAQLAHNTLLVAGQTRDDKSQITHDGTFVDLGQYEGTVQDILHSYDQIITKPHPWDKEHPLLSLVHKIRPDAQQVEDNIYYLMSQPAVTGLLTVNSSCAAEAEYFDLNVHRLKEPVLEIGFGKATRREGVYSGHSSELLVPDTWRSLLREYFHVTRRDGWRISEKPNRLRIALRAFWGFHGMDHDVFATPLHADLSVPQPPEGDCAKVNVLPGLRALEGVYVGARHELVFDHSDETVGTSSDKLLAEGPDWEVKSGQYRISGTVVREQPSRVESDTRSSFKRTGDQDLFAEVHAVSQARTVEHGSCRVSIKSDSTATFAFDFSIDSQVGGFEVLVRSSHSGRMHLNELSMERIGAERLRAA